MFVLGERGRHRCCGGGEEAIGSAASILDSDCSWAIRKLRGASLPQVVSGEASASAGKDGSCLED